MCGSLLARLAARRYRQRGVALRTFDRNWWAAFAVGVLLFLPGHIVPVFPLLYAPIAMMYGDAALAVRIFFGGCAVYWAVARSACSSDTKDTGRAGRRGVCTGVLAAAALVWFGGMVAIGLLVDPASVVSLSIHQPYGGSGAAESALCVETETYLFGLAERKRYICEDEMRYWTLCGEERPEPGADVYTICGTAGSPAFYHEYFGTIAAAVALHAGCAMCAFSESGRGKKRR